VVHQISAIKADGHDKSIGFTIGDFDAEHGIKDRPGDVSHFHFTVWDAGARLSPSVHELWVQKSERIAHGRVCFVWTSWPPHSNIVC
jgi:hypothetical protein